MWCAFQNPLSGMKPLLPHLLGHWHFPLAAESLFTQGQLTSEDWVVWLMQRYEGLTPWAPTEATLKGQ